MQHTIRLLRIDLQAAAPAVREALTLGRHELEALSERARAAGQDIELVILADAERFEVYTTEAMRQTVYRSVLGSLVERLPAEDRSSVRTTEVLGVAAAWHLMHLMVGSREQSGVRMLGALNTAVARARAAGTLGAELEALFDCAATAGWRIQGETTLGDPASSSAVHEIDWFEAERIIHEELVTWQAARASEGSVQSIPASKLDPSYYSATEPGSSVRLKAPHLRSVVSLADARRRSVA
jgi:glutamyl-tRNA reductase